jgi:VWFA-related protein
MIGAALLVWAALVGTLRAQAPAAAPAPANGPRVVFETPVDGDYVSGPSAIRVRIEPPDAAITGISVSADGKVVCTLKAPPFECAWNAGPKVSTHVVRAAVSFADGQKASATVRTKDAGYVEAVDVDVVQVTATVTDKRGEFVRGLTQQAFRIAEDDVPQAITSFASENIPLEVVVAIDVSYSMSPAMPVLKQAVKKFLEALRPTDKVTVIGFNDSVFTVARPTVDLAARLKAVDRMTAWGSTALYDVIVHSVEQLGKKPGRRALVVFTDGEDVASRVPLDVAERRLEASDAMVYAIGQGKAGDSKPLRAILERLATKSGGRAFFKDIEELGVVFGAIVEELSNQYLLGYVSGNLARDGRWRKITVQSPDRDLRIRARQGYRVEPR